MRERLTTDKTKIFARESPTLMSITKAELRKLYNEIFDRLQEYEVAEEQGQIIVPPCKPGTVVYVVRSQTSNGKNLYLRAEIIDHYRVFDKRAFMCFESGGTSVPNYLWETTVFLTREEAEAALVNYESSKSKEGAE